MTKYIQLFAKTAQYIKKIYTLIFRHILYSRVLLLISPNINSEIERIIY